MLERITKSNLQVTDDNGEVLHFRVGPTFDGNEQKEIGIWVEDPHDMFCFISKADWDKINEHVQSQYKKWTDK